MYTLFHYTLLPGIRSTDCCRRFPAVAVIIPSGEWGLRSGEENDIVHYNDVFEAMACILDHSHRMDLAMARIVQPHYQYRLVWLEICLLFLLYYMLVWVVPTVYFRQDFPRPLALLGLVGAAAYFFCLSPRFHGETLADRGMGGVRRLFIKTDSLTEDLRPYGSFALFSLLIMLIAIAVKMRVQGGFTVDWSGFVLKYFLYFISATLQDLLFFSVLLLRLKHLVHHHWQEQGRYQQFLTTLLLALLFGFAHLPNWPLLAFSVLFGFGMGWIYYRRPNLFLVAMSHAFLGAVLHRILQLHMKCGPFYGHYDTDASFVRKVVPGLAALIGDKW